MEVVKKLVKHEIIWAPPSPVPFVRTTQGGDFNLRSRKDVSIGYLSDADNVERLPRNRGRSSCSRPRPPWRWRLRQLIRRLKPIADPASPNQLLAKRSTLPSYHGVHPDSWLICQKLTH
jgi:hypothetical protein